MSRSITCPKCKSGMIENIANPGVFVCPVCHNIVDINMVREEETKEDIKEVVESVEEAPKEESSHEGEIEVVEEKEEIKEPIETEEEEEVPFEAIDSNFPIFDYDDNDGLVFYEKAPSFEDVFPYLDNDLLVVCDGSGGAGGFYHEVPSKKVNSLEKIKRIVLPEDKNGCLDSYLQLIFKPIIEEKGPISKRTSAFWASRIVMPRFVFAWKTFNRDIEKAREFVLNGMDRIIKLLKFETSNKSDKAILPTTFVAISVNKETDKEVDIDVYWAGDSRAYYFNKNGLKQLSIDDEKSTGEITNLFSRKEGFNTTINKRSYKLSKPCILFTCSDGIFDLFPDTLNLESNLLALLMKVNSMNQYCSILGEYYAPILSDDCTISMKKFGYPDFNKMKEDFKERFELDSRLYFKQREFNDAYEIKNDPSLYTGVIKRLSSRTRDIYPSLLSEMMKAIISNQKDVVFNGDFDEKIIKPYQDKLAQKKNELKEKRYNIVLASHDYLIKNFSKLYIEEIIDEEKVPTEYKPLFLEIQELIDGLRDYESGVVEYNEAYRKLDNTRKEIYDSIIEIITDGLALIPGVGLKDAGLLSSSYKQFKDKTKNGLSEELKEFLTKIGRESYIEEYESSQRTLKEIKEGLVEIDVNQTRANIVKKINEFYKMDYEVLYDIIESSEDPTILVLVNALNTLIKEDKDERLLEAAINKVFYGEEGNKYFIVHRLESGEAPSIFDHFFNPSVLKQAFTYHKALKLLDGEALKEFTEEYNAYEADALMLIK